MSTLRLKELLANLEVVQSSIDEIDLETERSFCKIEEDFEDLNRHFKEALHEQKLTPNCVKNLVSIMKCLRKNLSTLNRYLENEVCDMSYHLETAVRLTSKLT